MAGLIAVHTVRMLTIPNMAVTKNHGVAHAAAPSPSTRSNAVFGQRPSDRYLAISDGQMCHIITRISVRRWPIPSFGKDIVLLKGQWETRH